MDDGLYRIPHRHGEVQSLLQLCRISLDHEWVPKDHTIWILHAGSRVQQQDDSTNPLQDPHVDLVFGDPGGARLIASRRAAARRAEWLSIGPMPSSDSCTLPIRVGARVLGSAILW